MSEAKKLTEQQLTEYQEIFASLDTDGDGEISRDQLVVFLRGLDPAPTHAELDRLVAEADPNRIGHLDYTAFLSAMAYRMRYDDLVDEIRNLFSMLDTDGDGFITAAEFKRMMPIIHEAATSGEIEEILRVADSDADGRVSFDEFVRLIMN